MATIGTLSGLATILKKAGASIAKPRHTAPPMPRRHATGGGQSCRQDSARNRRMVDTVMKIRGSASRSMKPLIVSTKAMVVVPLDRARDAAVLAHPPEVDGHQDAGDE